MNHRGVLKGEKWDLEILSGKFILFWKRLQNRFLVLFIQKYFVVGVVRRQARIDTIATFFDHHFIARSGFSMLKNLVLFVVSFDY